MDVRNFKFASMVCQEWNRLGDRIVRFRNVELNYFIFQFEHRYHALPLATICTTSRQSIRGWLNWLSSNTDVAPRYFAASSFFALLRVRVVVFGRVDTFSSVRLPLCSRY